VCKIKEERNHWQLSSIFSLCLSDKQVTCSVQHPPATTCTYHWHIVRGVCSRSWQVNIENLRGHCSMHYNINKTSAAWSKLKKKTYKFMRSWYLPKRTSYITTSATKVQVPNSQCSLKENPKILQNFRSKNNTLKENFWPIFLCNICHCNSSLAFKSKNYYITSQNCMHFIRENSQNLCQNCKWALWIRHQTFFHWISQSAKKCTSHSIYP
jgi:hypothetical protein